MGPGNFIRIGKYAFKTDEIVYVLPVVGAYGNNQYKVRMKSVSVDVPKEVGETLMEFLV